MDRRKFMVAAAAVAMMHSMPKPALARTGESGAEFVGGWTGGINIPAVKALFGERPSQLTLSARKMEMLRSVSTVTVGAS